MPLEPYSFQLNDGTHHPSHLQPGSGYSLYGRSKDMLAYADDLTFVSESLEGLQAMLDTASRVATWAGLTFNPKKCATLHIDGKR
jgi:hypothetical protein